MEALGRLGFVGTGKITAAMVDGLLCSRCPPVAPIVLSPRGARAPGLLERHGPRRVVIAADNQSVLDASDTVFLALRPPDAVPALQELRFRPSQLCISLMHGISPSAIAAAAAGCDASAIVRANPLPGCATGDGITAMCPPHPGVRALFAGLGAVHEVQTLDELHVLHAASCLMGPIYQLMHTGAAWTAAAATAAAKEGGGGGGGGTATSQVDAERYMRDLLSSVAAEASKDAQHHGFASLVAQQTRGGLNENNIRRLNEAGKATHNST
jgi:pyrroline-5-carboxylate reductase|eukprot:COSAG06_NODE_1287_length_9996_cov_24.173083_11_plen_269_part_00